jgi:hypothetical protein
MENEEQKVESQNRNHPPNSNENRTSCQTDVSGSKIKCTCCPECGCEEYFNKNLVGDGFRMCRECHQEWWIDIKYDSPYCR